MRCLAAPVVLVAVLALAGCRTRIQTEGETEIYGGVGLAAVPDVGVAVTAGQYFSKFKPLYDFAFELRGVLQGGDDSATQDGEFFQVQAGVKQVTSPGHPRRWFFRYGITWMRANGDPRVLDRPGDYFGAYGAAGYEIDLGDRWTLSPEFSVNIVDGEGSTGTEFLPQVFLSLLFRF